MNNNLKAFEKVNDLFAKYGTLLTEAQQEIMKNYYEFNLSLSEIAENLKISRTAVSDSLKTSLAKLDKLESELHLVALDQKVSALIAKIKKAEGPELKALLLELERILTDGI
ncbi:MAG: DNA-binding protein [Firmicutes bacterium]|nr:DNA-binding protein [Bacillota bacterium]